jgi:hypothetical protein
MVGMNGVDGVGLVLFRHSVFLFVKPGRQVEKGPICKILASVIGTDMTRRATAVLN